MNTLETFAETFDVLNLGPLGEYGHVIKRFDYDPRGTFSITLANGTILGKRTFPKKSDAWHRAVECTGKMITPELLEWLKS